MTYDSVYPTFRAGAQARNGLGSGLRRSHLATMPDLWTRFDHRPWAPPQAGARCASRLDWHPPRPLPWVWEDLHLPPAAFSPLHPLQFAGALSGMRRRFVEHCSWEEATPTLKDPNRVPDPSTLRRWGYRLDCSQPAFSFFRQTLIRVTHWLAPGVPADHQAEPLSWLTPVLQILWPLRL
jgi:hypothetical protein